MRRTPFSNYVRTRTGSLVPRPQITAFWLETRLARASRSMYVFSLVPRPSPHVRERGSGVLNDFSCQMGRGSSRSESLNQIAERVIIGDDVGNRAQDLALQTEDKLFSQLICYVLGRRGRSQPAWVL